MTQRASIFDNDLKVDVSDFSPKKRPDITAPTQEQVRAVAEAANFPKPPGAGHIFETHDKTRGPRLPGPAVTSSSM